MQFFILFISLFLFLFTILLIIIYNNKDKIEYEYNIKTIYKNFCFVVKKYYKDVKCPICHEDTGFPSFYMPCCSGYLLHVTCCFYNYKQLNRCLLCKKKIKYLYIE